MKHVQITVRPDQRLFPTAPSLYGIFIEEINHAGDGGLLAELVQNRRFRDSELPPRCHWRDSTLTSPSGWTSPFPSRPGSVPGWTWSGVSECPWTLGIDGLTVRVSTGAPVQLVNEGFWGIPLLQGAEYRFRYRFATALSGRFTVSLKDPEGRPLASADLEPGASTEGGVSLVCSETCDVATLVLNFSVPGVYTLDYVSLFPVATWKNRPEGLRRDLVQTLADLQPRFLRFPGGCFVEGFSIETASRWKKTLGDVRDRDGQWTLWHYRTTNGLGFHEYLQLAEDLAMEPLFVVNCGLTCQGRPGEQVPVDELDEWVQDMLDAVEYANGDPSSPWGSLRALAGHPEPFGLRWIEIGNENFGLPYNERYRIFFDALKSKYPKIETIFNVHWEVGTETKGLPVEIVDEHFYPDGEYLRLYHNLYDTYDRSGPKVYVGEYAQLAGNQGATLAGALNEAAFMTGMERNQDLVVLSSYAPLLAHVRHAVWNPDLIYFDGTSVRLTPSYHVQRLFGTHRGDFVVPLELSGPTQVFEARGQLTIESRFIEQTVDLALDGLSVSARDDEWGLSHWGSLDATKYTVSGRLRIGTSGVKIRFLDRGGLWDQQNYFQWELEPGESRLVHIGGWSRAKPVPSEPLSLDPHQWYDFEILVDSGNLRCLLGGRVVHDHRIPSIPVVFGVATSSPSTHEVIIKVVNTGVESVCLDWNSRCPFSKTPGRAIVLDAAGLREEVWESPASKPYVLGGQTLVIFRHCLL